MKRSTVVRLPSVLEAGAEAQRALHQVVDYYHATLKESPEALGYLEKRGLRSSEMVEHFKLGFANRTLGYRLPQKNRQAGATHPRPARRARHPARDGPRALRGLAGHPDLRRAGAGRRDLRPQDHAEPAQRDADHLYLPGPHRGVFNVAALALSEEVILCEALIDALTFWCAGFRQRDGELRRRGLHRRPPGGLPATRRRARAHRLRPRRGRRPGGGEARREADGRGDRVLPGAVSAGDGRERVRAQGAAGGEEPRAGAQAGAVARQGQDGAGARSAGEGSSVEGESERSGEAAKRESEGGAAEALAAEASASGE